MPETYDLQTIPVSGVSDGVVTGLLKLAQRWSILLLTETGSKPFAPTVGCDFSRQLRNGELGSEAAVRSAFVIATQAIAEQLVMGASPEEQLESVELTGMSYNGSSLILNVRFLSAAGESRIVKMPVRYNKVVAL